MTDHRRSIRDLRREHPVFFWGTAAVLLLLLGATAAVAARVPSYRQQATVINERMTEAERETRDRILDSQARRSQLALALLQREIRLKTLEEEGIHLAISLADSTLSLRYGAATLRQVPLLIGQDSVIRAPDGRTWRFVRPLGERHLRAKEVDPAGAIPEWVYVSRGEPVPPEPEREIEGAMGRYVLRLDDGTEIYTMPESGPLANQVRPASFAVQEKDMRAIFDAVKVDVPVYIY